jgi:transcriptional regulator with XRE-family HTH domain
MTNPGQRIKEERLRKGWSQQNLADEISRAKKKKITRAAIAQWENGNSKTQKPENLFAAANVLGLAPQWVVNGSGKKYSSDELNPTGSNQVNEIPAQYIGAGQSISLSKEQKRMLSVMSSIDKEGLAILLKMGSLLANRPAGRRRENVGHSPERRLDDQTYDHGPDLSQTYDLPQESEQSKRRKRQ